MILLIDKLIPHYENPHEMHRVEEMSLKEERKTEIKPQLLRVDVVTALVLAIHNFPEGMVTFLAALKDINIAIPIACAIAIHNIPEAFPSPFRSIMLQVIVNGPFGFHFYRDWPSR